MQLTRELADEILARWRQEIANTYSGGVDLTGECLETVLYEMVFGEDAAAYSQPAPNTAAPGVL